MKNQYVFPALFGHDIPNQVGVAFPDIPGCTAQGDDDLDAIQQAREALSLLFMQWRKTAMSFLNLRAYRT